MQPELLACQSAHHAPLWWRGKWVVVGVGPLITSSRERRPPWGIRRLTLLSSLNTIFICYFFHSGWTTAFLHREGSVHIIPQQQSWQRYRCPSLQVKLKGVDTVCWFMHICCQKVFPVVYISILWSSNVKRSLIPLLYFVLNHSACTKRQKKSKVHSMTYPSRDCLNPHSTINRPWELLVSPEATQVKHKTGLNEIISSPHRQHLGIKTDNPASFTACWSALQNIFSFNCPREIPLLTRELKVRSVL